ncbi:MAG: hypothetical protein KIT09_11565 [Bryobacteraceae bacterium]|nr:hypothetical protein [Bryobacteraceae bacterium]
MLRAVFALIAIASAAWCATIRLYLTDGSYHVVREYEVKEDRVRFYSLERSDWEEIPLDLVDLARTRKEFDEKGAERKKEMEWLQAEETAEREHEREVSSVPMDAGVYLVDGEQLKSIPVAELEAVSDKRRSVLKVITPVPIVSGKQSVIVKGENAPTVVTTPTPEFYIRLQQQERFGLLRLKPRKGERLVEEWSVAPVTNQIYEQHEDVEVFRRQVDFNLYKLWPVKPLEPGEYAVAEFSPGEANIQIWDFGYWPGGTPASQPDEDKSRGRKKRGAAK